jgi:hypothetical protein
VLLDLWHRAIATQPHPPRLLVLLTGLAALAIVVPRGPWRLARNAITIAHEGGHALAAVVCGRRLQSIRLHSDTSGLTVTRGRASGLGMVFTLAAGYLAPSLLGLAAAASLTWGHITLTLWLSLLLLAGMLLMIRNVYGILSVLVTGGVVFFVSWKAPADWQAVFAYLGMWFLLFGGVRPVFEVQHQRRRGRAPNSDADQLARITPLPGLLWVGLFFVICMGALALSVLVLGILPTGTLPS